MIVTTIAAHTRSVYGVTCPIRTFRRLTGVPNLIVDMNGQNLAFTFTLKDTSGHLEPLSLFRSQARRVHRARASRGRMGGPG
jgi:hypothetical protein